MIATLKQQVHRVILISILLIILIYGFYFEKIHALDGFGYDGLFYGDYTRNFTQYIKSKYIDSYHFQRVGVPFVIHYIFLFLKIEFSNPNIVLAFSAVNVIFVFLAVIYYFRIAKVLMLSRNIEIIGFASLFYCFPILKFCLYNPVLMDVSAYGLSVMLAYHYLKRNTLWYFILLFIGSFIYPTFILLSVLFFFKKENLNTLADDSKLSKIEIFFKKVTIPHILICFSLPILLCIMYYALFWRGSLELMIDEHKLRPLRTMLIDFSFIISLGYLIHLSYFSRFKFNIKTIFKSINLLGVVLAIVLFLLTKAIVNYYSSKGELPFTVQSYLYNIIYQAVKNPFNFIVAHVFYFGLAPLLSFFLIKDIKKEIGNFGIGMILFFNLCIFFSVGSESRQLINYYPFLILILVIVLNKYWKISLTFTILFTITCIALSHFWYKINTATNLSNELATLNPFEFPDQRYFMFQGPWVNDYMYKVHLITCVVMFILIWIALKKSKLIVRKAENSL